MIRQSLAVRDFGARADFRWRGGEISRLEGLTDGIFAIAITLIVVSLDVPRTFAELVQAMKGFLAFGVCFALLMQIWYKHYLFFRRYGLQDWTTIALNAVLLFVVLLYVYPLKFLFALVLADGPAQPQISTRDGAALFTIYGAGFIAVFSVFVLLYAHAYRRRRALDLNEIEVFDTKAAIVGDLLYVAVGLLSILVAHLVPPRWIGLAGWTYGLVGVAAFFRGLIGGWKREKLETRLRAEISAGDSPPSSSRP